MTWRQDTHEDAIRTNVPSVAAEGKTIRRQSLFRFRSRVHNQQLSRYRDWLRAGRSGDRIPVGGAKFPAPVQTGPGAHPASCTMGTGSFPGVKWLGSSADHPPPSSAEVKERAIPLLPLWALVASCRVTFTFTFNQ